MTRGGACQSGLRYGVQIVNGQVIGGVGVGGLLEGEPRSDPKAWETYQRWILSGAMKAVAIDFLGSAGLGCSTARNFPNCITWLT